MEFIFNKSTTDDNKGVIYYRFLRNTDPTGKITDVVNKHECKKADGKKAESEMRRSAECKAKSSSTPFSKGVKTKISLGIVISNEEWSNYMSGTFDANAEMPSLGITYSKFGRFLEVIRDVVDSNRSTDKLKFMVQETIMKMIIQSC